MSSIFLKKLKIFYNKIMIDFMTWLKQEMERRNMNQKGLADAFGVSQSQVSRYLSGDSNPDALKLVRLAKAWNLSEKEVLAIGGYDENYKRIKKPTIIQSSEEISPKNEIQDDLDEKLERIAKEFDTLFLDHLGDLDDESKKKLISYLEFLIQEQDKRLGKENK